MARDAARHGEGDAAPSASDRDHAGRRQARAVADGDSDVGRPRFKRDDHGRARETGVLDYLPQRAGQGGDAARDAEDRAARSGLPAVRPVDARRLGPAGEGPLIDRKGRS